MRSIPPSSSATRATTATASATTWRSEASNPSSRHDRTARHPSNTIAKPTSDAISSSGASIASSNSGALPPDTRKPPELTFQCYASQQRNSGSKPSTRPNTLMQLSRSSVLELPLATRGRAIHIGTSLTYQDVRYLAAFGGKADTAGDGRAIAIDEHAPWPTARKKRGAEAPRSPSRPAA